MTSRADTGTRANEDPINIPSDAGSAWNRFVNAYQIVSNQIVPASASNAVIGLQADTPNASVQITIPVKGTESAYGVSARIVDANNFICALVFVGDSKVYLQKCISGTRTTIGAGVSVTRADGDTLKLECPDDDVLVVSYNGTPIITETDATHNTATYFGLFTNSESVARFTNVVITDLAAGGSVISGPNHYYGMISGE